MSENLPNRLAASPDLYIQKLDLARNAALVVQLDSRGYRAASFLDDRILTPGLKGGWTPLDALIEGARGVRAPRPLHFILHTGHVGSTLVSRLLDESGHVLGLREPLPLRTLADCHDTLHLPESLLSGPQFADLEHAILLLWSRGYDDTHAVVLKATSSACRIAPRLLTDQPQARAIYLNLAPEPYLATLLAGSNSVLDLRGHGPVRIRRLQAKLGATVAPLYSLSPGEVAAMSWLAEAWNKHDVLQQFGERAIGIDFDAFLGDVATGMARIAAHFGLPADRTWLDGIARSPVLTRYSKSPEFEYSPALRRELIDQARRNHGAEIRRGLRWLASICGSNPLAAAVLRPEQL